MKTCTKCGVLKNEDDFYRNGSCFHAHCKACHKARVSVYQRENKVAHYEATRRWAIKNPHKARAYATRWAAENDEKFKNLKAQWRSKNVAELREKWKIWAENNREKLRAKDMKRKAAKLRAIPAWTNLDKVEEFYFAADFLGMVTGDWYHVDHVVPLQSKLVCGLHWEQTLQVLPASDNLRKSNRHWPGMP